MSAPKARFHHISPDGGMVRLECLEEAIQALREPGFIWLDYHHPTREQLSELAAPFGLHPLSIEDCLDENQIPKVEDYPGHTFIIFNGFDYSNRVISIYEINLFIGERFLITTRHQSPENSVRPRDLESLVQNHIQLTPAGPAFLAHVILDTIVDQKFTAIEALEDDLNAMEDAILDSVAEFQPGRLIDLRRDVLALRKSLFHEREILVKICRKDSPFIPDQAILYYRDIYDHLAKFFELTESYREVVTSLMEMYLSILNNQMTRAANETSLSVRRLTIITTIFMPLTLLAGIGGMSEWSMMTGPQNWKIAYPLFFLGMAIIGVANFFILKWIEKRSRILD